MLKLVAILLVSLMLIKLEFIFRVHISLDAYKHTCMVRAHLFGIRVFSAKIAYHRSEIGSGGLVLQIGKKEIEIRFSDTGEDNKNSISLARIRELLSNLMISELGINAKIGGSDAFGVTMLMGSTKIIFYSLVSLLRSRQGLKIYESFTPFYNQEIFSVDIYGILNISIADIIFSLITNRRKSL